MRRCIAFPLTTAASPVPGGSGSGFVWKPGRCATALAATALLGLSAPDGASAQDGFLWAEAAPDRQSRTAFEDRGCGATDPLRRCPAEDEPAPLRPLREIGVAPALEPGSADTAFREYVPGFTLDGSVDFPTPGEPAAGSALRASLSELLAPYVDLPAVGRYEQGSFSPFIGGGLGAVRMRSGGARMSFPKTGTIVPGEGRVGRAWTVTAGVEVNVGSRSTLQLSWRYVDLFSVETGRGSGRVEWREHGSVEPLPPYPTSNELRSHGIRLSLRYGF